MSLVIAVTTFVANATPEAAGPLQQALLQLNREVQTGTLLLSEGDCLAVKIFSKSEFTHVGVVVVRNGTPFVYDSTNGFGVRCQTLSHYLKSQQPDVLHAFHPRQKLNVKRAGALAQYLDSQLGRPYSIKHFMTGKRADGVHCSEYATDALMACNLIRAQRPAKVSPASLLQGVLKADLYKKGNPVRLKAVAVAEPVGDSWCEQAWLDTKRCTIGCCSKMKSWILCN